MRRLVRFVAGVALGGGALAAYLRLVGVGEVVGRAAVGESWVVGAVVVLVVAEGLADSIGVWASVEPLGRGVSAGESVQFALAGDFFDILSPAGPVSSEPIMAQFIGATTDTSYSEALGVRSVAKYAKAGTQLAVSTALGLVLLARGVPLRPVVAPLGVGVLGVLVVGIVVLRSHPVLTEALVVVVSPVVARVSSLSRDPPHDRRVVERALERYWARVVGFRGRPGLLLLIALGGVLEQLLVAVALWVALAGSGSPAALLPIVVVVPLPQVASVVPVPASLGAYDVLLSGALVLLTGAPAAATAAAVLLVRTVSIPFGLSTGGLAVAFLRGWRP